MAWVRPVDPDNPREERGDRRLIPAIGCGGLLVAGVYSGLTDGRLAPVTLGLVALALVWLGWSVALYPNRTRRPWLVPVFFLGLLVISVALLTRNIAFFVFASVAYPYAFTLFTTRWALVAVTATALVQHGTLIRLDLPENALVYVLPPSLFVPVVIAGWIAAAESDLRQDNNLRLADANRRLTSALAENKGLTDQLLARATEAGRLTERQRLAGEIHDTLAQGLTGIVTHLQAAQRVPDDAQQVSVHLDRIHALAKDSLVEARRSVQALRPSPLDGSQLPDAIGGLTERWSQTHDGTLHLEVTGDVTPLATGIEITLFRVAQEALTNVAKHAQATRIGVTLSYADDAVLLDVRDDGVGFVTGDHDGYGLAAMRQRLRDAGGDLAIESVPGEGTAISATVPSIPREGGV